LPFSIASRGDGDGRWLDLRLLGDDRTRIDTHSIERSGRRGTARHEAENHDQ